MKALNVYVRILSLILFGAVLRTLFEVAYLGASREHHGFGPDKETSNYLLLALHFAILMIWSIVIIRKNNLVFRTWQILAISLVTVTTLVLMFAF